MHAPSNILWQWLIDNDLDDGGDWTTVFSYVPDEPDLLIAVLDIAGRKDARMQIDGTITEHPGFQVQIRSLDFSSGYNKIVSIAAAMDTQILRTLVDVDDDTYRIQAVSRQGPISVLGFESPKSHRRLFSFNGLISFTLET